ncbi:MAG: OB-fold domain-containing protein [Devosia sp.]
MEKSHFPDPKVLPDNTHFWQAAQAGQLLIPRCKGCQEFHWYPRAHCPFCHSEALEWIAASGRGTIYSFSVMRKADGGPYVIAYVTLAERVTMLANVLSGDPAAVRIGQAVQLVFRKSAGGQAVPMFEPAAS